MRIKFKTFTDVVAFTNICNQFNNDINLTHEKYSVDAKSYMGIASIGLNRVLDVHIITDDKENIDYFNKEMERFMVTNENY